MSEKELELFQQLISMLGEAGEGSFWLILFWLGEGYFTVSLITITLVVLFVIIYKLIMRVAPSIKFAEEVRQEANVPSWRNITASERNRVIDLIQKGKLKERE